MVIWVRFHVTCRRHKQGDIKRRKHRHALVFSAALSYVTFYLGPGKKEKCDELFIDPSSMAVIDIYGIGSVGNGNVVIKFFFRSGSLPSADTNQIIRN